MAVDSKVKIRTLLVAGGAPNQKSLRQSGYGYECNHPCDRLMVEQKYIDYWRDRQKQQAAESEALAKQAWADLQQIAQLLRSEFGATEIIVFGSLVQGDRFDVESDIDLAVKGIPPEDFFAAMAAVNRISHQWVDLKPTESLDSHFLQKVLKTGKSINAED
jgi:predicted nucleotidyltransferase